MSIHLCSSSLLLLMLVLVVVAQQSDDGSVIIKKTTFNNLDTSIFQGNNQVAMSRDKLFIFMWKNLTVADSSSAENVLGRNISAVKQSLDSIRYQLLPNSSIMMDENAIDNMRNLALDMLFHSSQYAHLRIGIDNGVLTTYSYIASFLNITTENNNISYFRFYEEMCRPLNVLEEYDIIITSGYSMSYYVRYYRDATTSAGRKFSNEMISTTDFFFVPLLPYDLFLIDFSAINNHTTSYATPGVCYVTETVFKGFTSDMISYNLLSRYGYLGYRERKYVEYVLDMNGLKTAFNDSLRQNLENLWKGLQNFTYDKARSYDDIYSLLLPSSCHMCSTSTCSGTNFKDGDYWIIPNSVIVLLYFLCLFMSQSFTKPFITRRLLMPYLPSFIIMYEFFHLNVWKNVCSSVFVWVEMFLISTCVSVYFCTIIRFYYLKNLYSLIRKFKDNFKIFKMLASVRFGILFTGLFSLVVSVLLSIHGVSMVLLNNFFVHNESIAAYVLFGAIVGILSIMMDTLLNIKAIKKNGIEKFLLFDDPFHIRFDLMQLMAVFTLIIINIIVVSTTPEDNPGKAAEPIPRFFINSFFIMICGGTGMLIELVNFIRFGRRNEENKNQTNDEEVEICKYLNNSDFVLLFEEYSEKEMSLENIYAYKTLMQIKKVVGEGNLTQEHLKDLEHDFIKVGSIHELNIPSDVRKQFNRLFERSSTSPTKLKDLLDIILSPLLMNIMDTFSRLVLTREYNLWEQTFNLQQRNGAVRV